MLSIKEATQITGGLSNPSKMPGKAYNLSAYDCQNGSKMAKNENTVCSGCYARKGRYNFSNVKNAMSRRLKSLNDPQWVDAMATLINKQSPNHFRWHDSGDIQSVEHLQMIAEVAKKTPDVTHWLPTKEYMMIRRYKTEGHTIPSNLIVRVSAPFIDQVPRKLGSYVLGSMVSTTKQTDPSIYNCPAYTQDNQCGDCRACWDSSIPTVSYPKH